MTRRLLLAFAAALLVPGMTQAAPQATLAEARVGGTSVEFAPQVDFGRATLTVSGPDGQVLRFEAAGAVPSFGLFDAKGHPRPDGVYQWELTLSPRMTPELRKALRAARARGEEGSMGDRVVSGSFAIAGGTFVDPGEREAPVRASAEKALTPTTAADQVIPDDLIVQGSACVGIDCVNNENFGFDTIRMKENNTRIDFTDTSSTAGFATQDWEIAANDSASGGRNALIFSDENTQIFVIESGNAANALYVDDIGRIGMRTSNPVLDLHIMTGNTPAIRLEQTNASGFTAQTWDIAGNEANFFVRDVSGGSLLPFRIRPGAPTSSIDIAADGDVGIGTASPASKLDVDSGKITIGGHNIGERASDATDLEAQSLRNTIYGIDSDNNSTNAAFIVSRNGDLTQQIFVAREDNLVGINRSAPSFPLHVGTDGTNGNGAHVTALGIWTDGSSRVNKANIRPLDAQDAFAALVGLEPVRYTGKDSPDGEEYLGFIAEDVPDLVAMNHRTGLSPMDIVAMLTKVVQEQQKTIDTLSARVEAMYEAPAP